MDAKGRGRVLPAEIGLQVAGLTGVSRLATPEFAMYTVAAGAGWTCAAVCFDPYFSVQAKAFDLALLRLPLLKSTVKSAAEATVCRGLPWQNVRQKKPAVATGQAGFDAV